MEEHPRDNVGIKVTVAQAEFVRALRVFANLARSPAKFRAAQFTLAPTEGGLELIGPGSATVVVAEGTWLGRASFSASIVFSNLKVPPAGAFVVIWTDTERLWMGKMSVPCVWKPLGAVRSDENVGLDKPADHLHTLELEAQCSDAVLIAQGHTKELFAARGWRKQRILDALRPLAELGVNYDDLVHLVARAISRRGK